jgi:hypothetical protein
MEKIDEIDYEKVLTNALNDTIEYAKKTGDIEKPEIKKLIEEQKQEIEEAIEAIRVSEHHDKRIRELVSLGYLEEAIILIVTLFEVKMRYFLKKSKGSWFYISHFSGISADEKIALRKKIQKYLTKIRMYDEFLRNLYLFQNTSLDAEIDCLYYTLFSNDRIINFQNLKDDDGVRKAYEFFLGIDISNCLDSAPEKSLEKWNLLTKLFAERHNIIHRGKRTTLTNDEIVEILTATDLIITSIVRKKIRHVKSEHEKIVKNLFKNKSVEHKQ